MLLTYLPLLVERLFQRCHLSRIDEVLKCGDSHDKTSHALPNSTELFVFSTFGLCDGSKNFNKRFSVSCEGGKMLYHDSAPLIVSLRTLWSAVIKSPNFSARGRASPVRLLQEDFVIFLLAISVFRKVSTNTVPPRFCYHFHRMCRVWFQRIACVCRQFCIYQIIFEIL